MGCAELFVNENVDSSSFSDYYNFAESCNSEVNEGAEVIRPALFSTIESMAGWMTVTSGVVSQVYPYQCGGDDVTRAQKRGVCGKPSIPFSLNLFDPVNENNAEAAWHEMMEEVKAYHPDFPRPTKAPKAPKKKDDKKKKKKKTKEPKK